jgi:hypothetical protein
MSFVSWLRDKFERENHLASGLEPISVSRLETPNKVIETKIQPIKIPTIVDVVDRLTSIFHELSIIKDDIVSRSWFESQYEDSSDIIINHLNNIDDVLSDINNKLSNFTKLIPESDPLHLISEPSLSVSDRIYNTIQNKNNVRYKDIISSLPFSDPTISKHLKILLNDRKIKRTKIGKAVYYTIS